MTTLRLSAHQKSDKTILSWIHPVLVSLVFAVSLLATRPARCSKAAGDAADLLEQGLYTEEAKGDLPAAMLLYQRVLTVVNAERPTMAEALLRLGYCYLKSGRPDDAAAAFDTLARRYPEETLLVAAIPSRSSRLKLLPTPWGTDETLVLRRSTLTAMLAVNETILVVRAKQHSGTPSTTTLESNWLRTRATLTVDTSTLRPIERCLDADRHTGDKWDVTYRHEAATMSRKGHGRGATGTFAAAQHPYDINSLFHVLRRLPLAEGYETTIPVLAQTRPEVQSVTIRFARRERVTVPAGTFDTVAARLFFAQSRGDDTFGQRGGDTTYWYSTDAARRLVKVAEGERTWELVQAHSDRSQEPVQHNDETEGISFDAPAGWLVVPYPVPEARLFLFCLSPDSTVFCTLRLHHDSQEQADVGQKAGALVERVREQGMLRGIRQDPDVVDVNGVPAGRVAIDYASASRQTKVQYYYFFVHRGRLLTLFFYSINPERWATIRPVLDDIGRSMRLR
jgi:hypothetical protein